MQNNEIGKKDTLVPILSLFTSIGTLLCCALPALLVTLGLGAALAGVISTAPWLTKVSEYKEIIFTIAGILICLSAFMQWNNRLKACPLDKQKALACSRLRKISWVILILSAIIYLIGVFFAFFAADIFYG